MRCGCTVLCITIQCSPMARQLTNVLHKLREWLTVEEAAGELSVASSDDISPADVLRLAIDGQLALSLYLPSKIAARCRPRDGEAIGSLPAHTSIEGLCEVRMEGRGKLQIEHDYHWLQRGSYIPLDGPIGALVEQGGRVYQLPPDRGESGFSPRPQSEFPQASVLAVRRTTLAEFATKHVPHQARPHKNAGNKPLEQRERSTLLVIIAALCQPLKIDPRDRGATIRIVELTETLGASVTDDTVRRALGQIDEALESRRQLT